MSKKEIRRILIGTYRPECLEWIQHTRLYNLPIVKGIDGASLPKFTHCVLFAKGHEPIAYAIRFSHVQGVDWLRIHKYPVSQKPHSDKYAIYALGKTTVDADSLLKDKKAIAVVSSARLPTCKIDDEFFTRPFPKTGGNSMPYVFEQLRPYFQRLSALYIYNPTQLDFMKELGIDTSKDIPFPGPSKKDAKFTFIDLFAGIGGFRQAMQSCGGRCVFTSEFDSPAQKTYEANYGDKPYGDITKAETKAAIPAKFDIVCAGFPCQAFSLAGKRMGFEDNFKGLCRGTLFKEVVEICEAHRPKAVFCENVKGLWIHDKGRTLKVIHGAFEEIGYTFRPYVLNSRNFGVPQNRERVYMVALRNDIVAKLRKKNSEWKFPFEEIEAASKNIPVAKLDDILEDKVPARYYLSDVYMETLRRHRARHEAAGHGFGYEIRDRNGVSGAIVCGGMGRERNLVQEKNKTTPAGLVPETHIKGHINQEGIRKMTPREWARLQGFPEEFKFVLSDVHLYKQFGNSVSIPVIRAISQKILDQIKIAEITK